MTTKNNKSKKKKKVSSRKNNGFSKLATITTKSISNAFVNFKKNQEIKK